MHPFERSGSLLNVSISPENTDRKSKAKIRDLKTDEKSLNNLYEAIVANQFNPGLISRQSDVPDEILLASVLNNPDNIDNIKPKNDVPLMCLASVLKDPNNIKNFPNPHKSCKLLAALGNNYVLKEDETDKDIILLVKVMNGLEKAKTSFDEKKDYKPDIEGFFGKQLETDLKISFTAIRYYSFRCFICIILKMHLHQLILVELLHYISLL